MSNVEYRRRFARLRRDSVKGVLTPGHGRYAHDESGKAYVFKSLEQLIKDRKFYATKANGGRNEAFIWSVIKNVDYVVQALTASQRGYLLLLSTHIDYEGRLIRSENDKTPMSKEDMRKVLRLTGTKDSSFYDFLDACMNHGIITHDPERDVYYVTKRFHFKGSTYNERVVKTMVMRLREMAKELTPNDIGLLYGIIPYIHVSSNYICANPEESDLRHVVRLNQRELAEKLRIHPKSLARAIGRMSYRGHPMFAKVTAGGRSYFMVTPLLFLRNVDSLTDSDRLTFGILDGELRKR